MPPPGLTLPASTAEHQQATSLVVAIQKDAIYLGGERVASVSDAMASNQMLIPPLAQKVKAAREQMDGIALRRGTMPQQTHIVTIQGDTDIEFRVLQKVMYTLDQGGFPDIALAVLKKA